VTGGLLVGSVGAMAQITGEEPAPPDSLIVFEPAQPLVMEVSERSIKNALGADILFSGSGWGFGAFYHRKVFDNGTVFANFGLSGRRNTDELEDAWLGAIPVVSSKVNRLFMIPMTFGVQYRLFAESLQESFRPFVATGVTPTIILSTPYLRFSEEGVRYYEFFESFGYTESYFRWGAMFAIGAMFGDPTDGSVMGVMMRYYTIPFGDGGLESVRGLPIENFGGVMLTLSIGKAW